MKKTPLFLFHADKKFDLKNIQQEKQILHIHHIRNCADLQEVDL
jgi:hypothetical protein